MHYVKTDAAGRLTAWAAAGYRCGEGEIAVALPDGFSPDHLTDWVLSDGVLTYDPLPVPAEPTPLPQRMDEIELALMELAALIGGDAL